MIVQSITGILVCNIYSLWILNKTQFIDNYFLLSLFAKAIFEIEATQK